MKNEKDLFCLRFYHFLNLSHFAGYYVFFAEIIIGAGGVAPIRYLVTFLPKTP